MARVSNATLSQIRTLGLAAKSARTSGGRKSDRMAKVHKLLAKQQRLLKKIGLSKTAYISMMQERGYEKIANA